MVATVVFVSTAYSFFSTVQPLLDIKSVPFPVLPKLPLTWAAMIAFAGIAFVAIEGGYRVQQAEQAKQSDLKTQLAAMKAQLETPAADSPRVVEELYRIDFKYLPASPLEKGWRKAYNPDGAANFGTDLDIPDSPRMEITKSMLAMDHPVPDHAKFSDNLKFTVKYTSSAETMVFTGLDVATKDGSDRKRIWIKYYYGERHAEKTKNFVVSDPTKDLHERTVWLPAKVIKGGISFDLDLPDVVQLAVGEEGWIYKSVWGVRLRGNLSISPLVFGKII